MLIRMLVRWINNCIVPRRKNDHQPYILRTKTVVFIFGFILLLEIFLFLQTLVVFRKTDYFASVLPEVLIDLTNENREKSDVYPLKVNPLLEQAAQKKAEDMASRGYFSHNTPEGYTPWFWLKEAGYEFSAAGENLAVNFFDSKDIEKAWMRSPAHKVNITNGNFTEIGIGIAQGAYKGRETIFVVQFFGKPASQFRAADVAFRAGKNQPEEMFVMSSETNGEKTEIIPEAVQYSSWLARAVSAPKTSVSYLLIVFGTAIALSLALKLLIRFRIRHLSLVCNGCLLLILIASALVLNNYFLGLGAQIY